MTSRGWLAVLVLTLAASIGLTVEADLQVGLNSRRGPSAQELYQRALVLEHADGDLNQAISLYAQAAQQAGDDRALAAKALRHMAGAQEKLGRAAEAAAVYAELIRTYPEQHAEVAIAQARLAVLRGTAQRVGRDPRSGPGSAASPTTSTIDAAPAIRSLVETYCLACHNGRNRSGGLDLDAPSRANVAENTELWEKVTQRLQARRDPPLGATRPADATYGVVIARLEHALDAAYSGNRGLPSAERVTDTDLVARLAAFLWNGTPDATLLEAARRGDLREPAALQRQVLRMLRDPRSGALIDTFFAQWLSLDRLRNTSASPQVDRELVESMNMETRLFLQSQLRDDRDAVELWTANYTFVNERLARHYGLTGISGKEFRRTTWPNTDRAGLLGQAGPLTALSTPERTSPTRRGLYVLTRYLGMDAPNPPANIPPLEERPANPSGTLRDRLTAHRSNPSCANCHRMFDPLGFGLENFDATGGWRLTDSGFPIDASGTFLDGTHFNGPADLRAGLLKYRAAYYTGLTQRLLAYALHRAGSGGHVYDYEMAAVRKVVRDASAHGYRWSSILAGICASTPFQMKHVVP